jgi:hypothetical protein
MTFLNSVNAITSWVLRVPSNLSALRSHRCSGTSASSAFVAIAKHLASGTTLLLVGEPGRPRLVTPGKLVSVNGLGLGYSYIILDIPPTPEGGELVRIRPDRVVPLAESLMGMEGE